jgi:hypothetical protein
MNIRSAWVQLRRIPRGIMILTALFGISIGSLLTSRIWAQKDDWPVFRLNEIKGAIPPVLYLAGKYNENRKSSQMPPREGEFEIFIRGTDYYFLRCWHGNPAPGPITRFFSEVLPFGSSGASGWSQVRLIVKDFEMTRGRRWGRFGSQGGGGGGEGGPESLAPRRRLWNQLGFIGALEEGQINKKWYATETFSKLRKVGNLKIPRLIEFDHQDYLETFRVTKCEFRTEPNPEWFLAKKQELFPGAEGETKPAGTNSSSILHPLSACFTAQPNLVQSSKFEVQSSRFASFHPPSSILHPLSRS